MTFENEMNYKMWFGGDEVSKRQYTECNTMLNELGGYDSDPEDSDDEKDVVDFYFSTILKDKTGKFFFISRRRVKWFLLAEIHLTDCTLTYKKLWDSKIKDNLLKKLEILSKSFEIDDCQLESIPEEKSNVKTPQDFMTKLKKDNLKDYQSGKRKELDLSYRTWSDSGMSDDNADHFIEFAFNGEQFSKNLKCIVKYKSDYMVGEMLDKFTLKIFMYQLLLLQNHNETFDSYYDSSPLSDLKEEVGECLNVQHSLVVDVVGKKEADRLLRIRNRLEKYSKVSLTMFQVYRMFNVL